MSTGKEPTAAASRATDNATNYLQHSSDQQPPGQGTRGDTAVPLSIGQDKGGGIGSGLTQQQQQQSTATVIFNTISAAESNTLCKLKAAVAGVSAVRVPTMTTGGKRGIDKVVVSACAKDLSTVVVDSNCSRTQRSDQVGSTAPAAATSVVRSSFVAHAGMSGGGSSGVETSLAQQMASRVGSSLPLFLGNVVAAPFLAAAGVTAGATAQSSSCRLSVDGEHVLISAVKGLECSLYRYSNNDDDNNNNSPPLP